MKKKGVGISCVLHPSGNKGAGDPSSAAIQLKPDGTFVLLIGAVDIGQGSTTILRQIAAETMQVPIENVFCSNFADDFAPLSFGSFASRVTLIESHAVENACEDLKQKIRLWASDVFIGYGIVSIAAGECHFLNICIAPVHQQQGHGARLVAHLLHLARHAGARSVFLEVRISNGAAFRLYHKMGFNELGLRKGYYPAQDGREDALVLAREL